MNQLQKPDKMKPALIAGVALGLASAVPGINFLNLCCCAWVIAGGVLATYLYQKNQWLPLQYGDGFLLGALAGLFGAVTAAIVTIPIRLIGLGAMAGFMEAALEELRNNPDVPAGMVDAIENLASPEMVGAAGFIIGLVTSVVIYGIFGAIGGAIGVAIFQKKSPPAAGDSAPPPPAPTVE